MTPQELRTHAPMIPQPPAAHPHAIGLGIHDQRAVLRARAEEQVRLARQHVRDLLVEAPAVLVRAPCEHVRRVDDALGGELEAQAAEAEEVVQGAPVLDVPGT
jgi:hypothetical protein